MFDRIRYRLRAILRGSAIDRERRDELARHLDRKPDVVVADGMSPSAAAARREFGRAAAHPVAGRLARCPQWIDSLRVDVRFALRYFARKPLATTTIVLLLALGIGGASIQLSVLQTFTQRPPPGIPEDLPLVHVRGMYRANGIPTWRDRSLWYGELREMAELPNTFAALVGWTSNQVVARVPGALDGGHLTVQFVTPGFFRTIGVRPTNGPGLPATGDASQPAGVISYGMWEDVFDRGDVAGRVVTINGVGVRVASVAPPLFSGLLPIDSRRMMWVPLSARAAVIGLSDSSAYASLDSARFEVVGRLAPGVSPQRATAVAHIVTARVAARMLPPSPRGAPTNYIADADVVPLRGITWGSVGRNRALLLAAWALLTTLVLAIVCTNVGGLVISAGMRRHHEIGIRLALGASRARVIRQLLTESMLLALAGGGLGLLVFRAGVALASRVPEIQRVRPDLETVGLTMLLALGTAILFGLTPAFHATRQSVAEGLKSTGSGATRRSRMHQAFVIGQVVAAVPLLVLIASLTTTMMQRPSALPAGIPDHVLKLGVYYGVPGSPAQRLVALDRLTHRLGEIPDVVGVVPDAARLRLATLSVRPEDRGSLTRAGDPIQAEMLLSKPGYFDLLGVPLVLGTDLPPADSGWTAVIGSDLARALRGTANPIGRRLRQVSPALPVQRDLVVTGVYDADRLPAVGERASIYITVKDWPAGSYLVRTQGPAVNLADTVRRIAHAELPSAEIDRPLTLAQIDAVQHSSDIKAQEGAAACAALVLLLSSIGLYGIVALSVGQRHREIGVRMALGARAGQVVGLFYSSGLALGVLGLIIGLPIGLFAARFLPVLAVQGGAPRPRSPSLLLVGGLVAGVMLVVTSIATLIPASRAATVDPVGALRAE